MLFFVSILSTIIFTAKDWIWSFFSARGTTRCCKSCSYGCIHMPKKNNQRRRRLIICYWQLAQRSWFWFWAEWRETLCGNRARQWRCKPDVFKMHVFSAVRESWTLTRREMVDLVQNSHFGFIAVYLFFLKGQSRSLSNREGRWKKRTVFLDR